jgi:hypothetical protein
LHIIGDSRLVLQQVIGVAKTSKRSLQRISNHTSSLLRPHVWCRFELQIAQIICDGMGDTGTVLPFIRSSDLHLRIHKADRLTISLNTSKRPAKGYAKWLPTQLCAAFCWPLPSNRSQ